MESNEKNYSRNGMGEGDPGNINPRENDYVAPAKNISEIEKLERNESGSGVRDSHRQPEEFIAEPVSQIDDQTKKLHEQSLRDSESKQFDTDDETRTDNRDKADSTQDWDAEQNRTGRNK